MSGKDIGNFVFKVADCRGNVTAKRPEIQARDCSAGELGPGPVADAASGWLFR